MSANALATYLENLALANAPIPTETSLIATRCIPAARAGNAQDRHAQRYTARRRAFARAAFQQDSDVITRRMEQQGLERDLKGLSIREIKREIARRDGKAGKPVLRDYQESSNEELGGECWCRMGQAETEGVVMEIEGGYCMNSAGSEMEGWGQGEWAGEGNAIDGLCGGMEDGKGTEIEGLCLKLEEVQV